ncbi:hypothetical protein OIU78_022389 [Salix suchowensis]|nr:hypothetical protein OIU78_022389 [Salix suchowensis]
MNPSTPHLNHLPFPYPSQNPNPNHNFLLHAPPPPKPPQVPPPITTILDLPTTLSALTNLLSHTHQTLSSLSPQITLSKPQNANFIPCPFNRHHLMPPESLFLHSLNCPVPLFQHPSSPFDYLHYPNTLNPQDPHKDSNFTQSIQDPNETDLCFSLDSYYNQFSSHFSYNDCPGAVNLNDLDSSKRMFALPGVLLIECVNFGAIRKEALSSVSSEMNVKSLKCPILVQVLMWIGSQLSILYGEVNAKCFAIHVLKQCLLEAANEVVVSLLDSCLKESLKDLDAYENEIKDSKLEGDDRVIFVTQVAAAVAALHERSILEAKIKLLRVPQQLPRYQRMAEHSFVSKRADDERSKRP